MREILLAGLSAYASYSAQGTAVSAAIIAAILLTAYSRGTHRRVAVITLVITVILALPVTGWLVTDVLGHYGIDRSPFETVPIALIFGCAFMVYCDRRYKCFQGPFERRHLTSSSKAQNESSVRYARTEARASLKIFIRLSLAFALMILATATVPWRLTFSNINFSLNPAKISPATREVASIISEISENEADSDTDTTLAIMPRRMSGEVGESGLGVSAPLIDWSSYDETDVLNMVTLANRYSSDFVVLHQSEGNEAAMAAHAFTLRSRTAGYEVYQRVRIEQ